MNREQHDQNLSQVQSGSVTWDLVVTGSGGATAAAADGCLEKLITVSWMSDFWHLDCIRITVGSDVFATVMAWNTDKYGEPGSPRRSEFLGRFLGCQKFPEPELTVQITSMVRWNQP